MSNANEPASDGYVQEIQKRIPLRLAAGFLVGLLLYCGAKFGAYQSSLLSVLNFSVDWFIKNKDRLLELPIYVYVVVAFVNIALHYAIQQFNRWFFRYVVHLPPIAASLQKQFQNAISPKASQEGIDALMADVELARNKTLVTAGIAHMLLLIGGLFVIVAFFDSFLDFCCGILLLMIGLVFLYKSCGVFLAELAPKRALLRSMYSALEKV